MITSLFKNSIFRGRSPEVVLPTVPLKSISRQIFECKQVVSVRGNDIELIAHGKTRAEARDRMIDKMLKAGIPIGDEYTRIPEPEAV